MWLELGQFRISGTSAYPSYTFYNENNGAKAEGRLNKMENIVFSKFSGNLATEFGKNMRIWPKKHLKILKESKNAGLITNEHCSWFGFSPNGYYQCGDTNFLIEIKCPVAGKSSSKIELLKMLKYILANEVTGELKFKKTSSTMVKFC